MTEHQQEAVKQAFISSPNAGVEEDSSIEELFESNVQRDRKQCVLACIREHFSEDSRNFISICHGMGEK